MKRWGKDQIYVSFENDLFRVVDLFYRQSTNSHLWIIQNKKEKTIGLFIKGESFDFVKYIEEWFENVSFGTPAKQLLENGRIYYENWG